jgi:hypothetical protein
VKAVTPIPARLPGTCDLPSNRESIQDHRQNEHATESEPCQAGHASLVTIHREGTADRIIFRTPNMCQTVYEEVGFRHLLIYSLFARLHYAFLLGCKTLLAENPQHEQALGVPIRQAQLGASDPRIWRQYGLDLLVGFARRGRGQDGLHFWWFRIVF